MWGVRCTEIQTLVNDTNKFTKKLRADRIRALTANILPTVFSGTVYYPKIDENAGNYYFAHSCLHVEPCCIRKGTD